MSQAITKDDLDNLEIDKERAQSMTLDELQGDVYDTRNQLQSRKWTTTDRSGITNEWSTVTRS